MNLDIIRRDHITFTKNLNSVRSTYFELFNISNPWLITIHRIKINVPVA